MRRACSVACGTTKADQLRQRAAAKAQCQPNPYGTRKKIPLPDPKRVDFKRPTQTKAQLARVKRAEEVKREIERREAEAQRRTIKRTPAPIGGDVRLGREGVRRPPPKPARTAAAPPRPVPPCRPCSPVAPRAATPPPPRTPKKTPAKTPKKTCDLAKVMNADVIHAEPVGCGPITNVVIPPGVVNDKRTTVVSIPQPTSPAAAAGPANRSMNLINKSLNEQDAAESQTVQDRLSDLQQARRDFVLTVASVGNKSVNLIDEIAPEWATRSPSPPRRNVYRPPPDEDYYQLEHGIDHPDVVAARAFMQQMSARKEATDAARRMDDEFDRIAAMDQLECLDLDVPLEEELYLDKEISWEEDEAGMAMPVPSRVKAYTEDVPVGQSYTHDPFDPNELERFFDLERYPPVPCEPCKGRPVNKEGLHPDLWELDDPWYRPPPCSAWDAPDLIEFDLIDFD